MNTNRDERDVAFVARDMGDYWVFHVMCGESPRDYALRKSDGELKEMPDDTVPFVIYPKRTPPPSGDGLPELPDRVAVVGGAWLIAWTGDGPIAPLVRSHGLKIGDGLFTADQMQAYARQALLLSAQVGGGDGSLDDMPKELLKELRGPALRENALKWRGERNRYRNLHSQALTKIDRLEKELQDARDGCRRLAQPQREGVVWVHETPYGRGYSFASEELMRDLADWLSPQQPASAAVGEFPHWWDVTALEVATRFTQDTEPQWRASLQCAVRDAMAMVATKQESK